MTWTKSLVDDHKMILRSIEVLRRMGDRCENQEPDAADVEDLLAIFREFADDYHQGKEESVLFPALMQTGMGRQDAPLRPLLFEHDQERSLIAGLEDALKRHSGKDFVYYADRMSAILATHIYKEENILFEIADIALTHDQKAHIEKQFNEFESMLRPGTRKDADNRLRRLESRYLGKTASWNHR